MFYIQSHDGKKLTAAVFTEEEAREYVTFFNTRTQYGKTHPITAHNADETPEETRPLRVCSRCLMAIESREGSQITRAIYLDTDDETPCDWCENYGDGVLYEIL